MPKADCPRCAGTGIALHGNPGDLSEQPWETPCDEPSCYQTSDALWQAWSRGGLFEHDTDTWDDVSAPARALRERYFALRKAERLAGKV